MEISKQINYSIFFTVAAFEETEGGMIYEEFKYGIETMEEAIQALEYAYLTQSNYEWRIICSVKKDGILIGS